MYMLYVTNQNFRKHVTSSITNMYQNSIVLNSVPQCFFQNPNFVFFKTTL